MGALDAERLARLLADKISALPDAYVAEIEAFIDSIVQKAGRDAGAADLTRRAMLASEPSFAAVWDNPDDAIYDDLIAWAPSSSSRSRLPIRQRSSSDPPWS